MIEFSTFFALFKEATYRGRQLFRRLMSVLHREVERSQGELVIEAVIQGRAVESKDHYKDNQHKKATDFQGAHLPSRLCWHTTEVPSIIMFIANEAEATGVLKLSSKYRFWWGHGSFLEQ